MIVLSLFDGIIIDKYYAAEVLAHIFRNLPDSVSFL